MTYSPECKPDNRKENNNEWKADCHELQECNLHAELVHKTGKLSVGSGAYLCAYAAQVGSVGNRHHNGSAVMFETSASQLPFELGYHGNSYWHHHRRSCSVRDP